MDRETNTDTLEREAAQALAHIWRLGGRRAAEDLSAMSGHDFFVNDVTFRKLPLEDLSTLVGSPDDLLSTVLLEIRGDCRGEILLLIPHQFSDDLVTLLFGDMELSTEEFALHRAGALQEAGNILGSAFLNAIALLSNLEILPTVPTMAEDMVGAILDIIQIKHAQDDNYLFLAESGIRRGGHPFELWLVAIFERSSLELIVRRITTSDPNPVKAEGDV